MVIFFKESIITVVLRFVSETVFISEQTVENRFGALLEISDKFITKFNVFGYMILQFRLKTVSKISKPYCNDFKNSDCFAWKVIVCTTKVRNKTFRNAKKKIRRQIIVSPLPLTMYGELFLWKSFAWRANFLGEIYGRMFYMGANDQITEGERFQGSSQSSFLLIYSDLGYSYIIWKFNTTNTGLNLKNTCVLCFWGCGFHEKPLVFLKKLLVVTCSLMSWL